jgi:hypothetical protein
MLFEQVLNDLNKFYYVLLSSCRLSSTTHTKRIIASKEMKSLQKAILISASFIVLTVTDTDLIEVSDNQ